MRPSKKGKVNDAIHSVNVTRTVRLVTTPDENTVFTTVPIIALLTSSKIHLDLSNVWNNYKIVSINVAITPLFTEDIRVFVDDEEFSDALDYFRIFSAWDDNEVNRQLRYADIKTYQSYKDVMSTYNANNKCPVLLNRFKPMMKNMDTKKTPNQGTLIVGLTAGIPFGDEIALAFSITLTFSVCYSVIRLDKSWVSTMIAPEFQKLPPVVVPTIKEVRIPPQITKLVYFANESRIGLRITYETNINDGEFTYATDDSNMTIPHGHVIMTLRMTTQSGVFEDFRYYAIIIRGHDSTASFNTWVNKNTYYKIYPRPDVWDWVTLQDKSGKVWLQANLGGLPDIDLFHFPNLSKFVEQY